MSKIPVVDSKFRFVLVAANRAEQIMRGARPKVEVGKRKPTRLAMEEVNQNLVEWGYGAPPQPEEQAPEQTAEESDPTQAQPVEVH
jgi:DNA-directed RNA polymerase subunit omega